MPTLLRDRDDVQLWPGNPAESRARLQALVDRELPRLRALEETLRVQYEEPARAAAQDMALARVTREETSLLRAERMYEQSYVQAATALQKVCTQTAVSPVLAADREIVESPILHSSARPAVGGRGVGPGGPGVGEDRDDPAVRPASSSPGPKP